MGRNDISADMEESLDMPEYEYVKMDNGEIYKAVPKDEMNDYEVKVIGY